MSGGENGDGKPNDDCIGQTRPGDIKKKVK